MGLYVGRVFRLAMTRGCGVKQIAKFKVRAKAKEAIRGYFAGLGFDEVDTPVLVNMPGVDRHMEYFSTDWKDFRGRDHKVWLRSSPEVHMKILLSLGDGSEWDGLPRIYQMGPCFRNHGELGAWHSPEFTMLEWYQVGLTMDGLVQQTIDLISHVYNSLRKAMPAISWRILDATNLLKISVKDAFRRFAGIELQDGDDGLASIAIELGYHSVVQNDDFETAYFKILLDIIEPQLANYDLAILYDYPPSQSSLSKVDGGVAKRFEVYLKGVEVSNGYDELTDVEAHQTYFQKLREERTALAKECIPVDREFLVALQKGIPNCSGNALGLDRLLSLFLGDSTIHPITPGQTFQQST